jgi:uncharacterized membrane protein SpoIIM required for sporulation
MDANVRLPRFDGPQALADIVRRNVFVWSVICLGTVSGGLLTVIGIGGAGFFTSLIVLSLFSSGAPARWLLVSVAPHGILEWIAFSAAGACGSIGFYLPRLVVTKSPDLRKWLIEAAVCAVSSLAVLFIAAFIEVLVTPHLIEWLITP